MSSPSVVVRRMVLPVVVLLLVVALGLSLSGILPRYEPAAATSVAAAEEQPRPETGRAAAIALLDARAAGDSPEQLAERFTEDVDWYMQGDESVAPWLGRQVGRAGAVEHFTQLAEMTTPERFEVETIIGDGDRAVVLGTFTVRVHSTGRSFDSEYAFDITAGPDGLITRYHVMEDSWALSEASQPQG